MITEHHRGLFRRLHEGDDPLTEEERDEAMNCLSREAEMLWREHQAQIKAIAELYSRVEDLELTRWT